MSRVFDVVRLLDVPERGRSAVLLTARSDLDLGSEQQARSEIGAVDGGPAGAVLLDLTHVFVGVSVVRCIDDLLRRPTLPDAPLAVVAAPHWLGELTGLLGLPPLVFARTVDDAVSTLAARDGHEPVG